MKLNTSSLYFRAFVVMLVCVSAAFFWVLAPYYPSIFWGTILAIVFMPMHRKLLVVTHGRKNTSALITLLAIVVIVILPLALITGSLIQEGAMIYQRINNGDFSLGAYFEQIMKALPASVHDVLTRFGVGDILSLKQKLTQAAVQGSRFLAGQAVNVGQNTFQFVVGLGIMLYLLFFLLRDGTQLARRARDVIPLSDEHQQLLFRKFATVVRATVKGNIAVAATQGALGGLIFWILGIQGALLWGVVMAFLSLLPAVGAALIWLPVAIYFLVSGAVLEGSVLILFGVLVIGLVDNVLRPLLVGKDTKIPDYVILISTLGGLSVFGLNGFVIGPLFAALFIACWDLFPSAVRMNEEKQSGQS
jgi:predicted PurR-regulated permease PerM